jgi:nucleoside-diphosphate-sugar epimerase
LAVEFDKVMVTGGSGLLGRFVVDEMLPHADVSVLDIKPPVQQIDYLAIDVLDADAISAAVAGHDAIIHLAGIDDGNDFPDYDYFRTNVQGTWNLLHAAEAAGVRKIVVASSTAAYGVGRDPMPDYLPMDEAHPQRPTATYSLTKQIIEVQCRSFVGRGTLSIVCLRPTLIVRPEREAAILAQLDLDDPDSEPPQTSPATDDDAPYGALSVLRSYVRSADAARCFRLALGYDEERFDVFNVGAADGIGHEKTLPHLEGVYGRLPEIRKPDIYDHDPFASTLDSRRARERLGWEPRGDWDSIVDEHRPTNQKVNRP